MNGGQHPLALQPTTTIKAGQKKLTFNEEFKRGGFGIIYKGSYKKDDYEEEKIVAIKEYLPEECAIRREGTDIVVVPGKEQDFDEGLEWFRREADILAECKHPNIVSFYDIFEAHKTAYIVMEFVNEPDLSKYLNNRGKLQEARLKKILCPLLDALEVVHQKEFVHRDIKPSNIILRSDDSPVLLDFGAAQPIKKNQKVMVTDHYSPPEQYGLGRAQGPWTDIYALGVVCYEALADFLPSNGDVREDNKNNDSIELYGLYDPNVSEEFLDAISNALKIEPQDRPQSVEAWREMMEPPSPKHESAETAEEGDLPEPSEKKVADDVPPTKQGPIPRKPRFKWFARASIVAFLLEVILQGILLVKVDKYIDNYRKEWEKRQEQAELDRSREEAEEAELKAELDRFYVETGLKRGPKPDGSHEGELDLHITARLNLHRLTKDLLNKGADIHAKVDTGFMSGGTVLHTAAWYDAAAAAAVLLDGGADIYARIDTGFMSGRTPLHLAAETPLRLVARRKAAVKVLLDKGANPNIPDKAGRMPLHYAAAMNKVETAKVLLDGKAYVDAKDKDDKTPLHLAAQFGSSAAADALLAKDAYVNAKDKAGRMPLHYAAAMNEVETAKVLLDGKAYVDAKEDSMDRTPLHLAAWHGHSVMADTLLAGRAYVDVKDKDDKTPLHLAVWRGYPKVVGVLLYKGADMNAKDKDGNTPKDINHSESIGELFDRYTHLRESLKSLRESSK